MKNIKNGIYMRLFADSVRLESKEKRRIAASGYDGYISTDETSRRKGNYMLREEAIKKHRAMWTWIAEQIVTNEHTMNIAMLKQMYIEMQGDDLLKMYLHNNCYLCCYTDFDCRKCPLLWPSDAINYKCEYGYRSTNGYSEGLYDKCCKLYYDRKLHYECDWELQVTLCRKIANLPERKDVK